MYIRSTHQTPFVRATTPNSVINHWMRIRGEPYQYRCQSVIWVAGLNSCSLLGALIFFLVVVYLISEVCWEGNEEQ